MILHPFKRDHCLLTMKFTSRFYQGCGVGIVMSRRFLGGVEFLTTDTGSRIFCPTPDAQLDHFLHHTLKLGIPVEMLQFHLKLILNQRFLAVYHDFH